MKREEFMESARERANDMGRGFANKIMNLVEQAWAEGKASAELESLTKLAAEAFTRAAEQNNNRKKEPVKKSKAELLEVERDGLLDFWLDDICFCTEEDCPFTNCLRNAVNIRVKSAPHSFGDFKGTELCKFRDEVKTE